MKLTVRSIRNPSRGPLGFAVDAPSGGEMELELFDVEGREVLRSMHQVNAGHSELAVPVTRRPMDPGSQLLFYRVSIAGERAVGRVVLLH